MSIRLRVVAVFGGFAVAAVLVVLALMIVNARQAVRDEMTASLDLVAALVGPLAGRPDALGLAVGAVNDKARHIDIVIGDRLAARHAPPEGAAPDWFARLVGVAPVERRIETAGFPAILLRADPQDELGEVWADVSALGTAGAILLPLSLAVFALFARQALRPVDRFVARLDDLRRGRFDRPVPPCPVAELAPLAAGIEALRRALADKTIENLDLAASLLRAQDEERQALARDVHDHLGPLIFALKIELSAASAEARGFLDEMQLWHRQIIDRLHPPLLDHLPLSRILADRIARWRRLKPGIDFRLVLPDGLDRLSPVVARTLHLAVQEAILNALRHGGASAVDVALTLGDDLALVVADDGKGLDTGAAGGIGLATMAHRVRVLGGTMAVDAGPAGGTRLCLRIPLAAGGGGDAVRLAG